MNRWLFFLGLLLVSTGTLAGTTSFPALFTPANEDLSIWYLGNIFGSDLMTNLVASNYTAGISSNRLLSTLFGIFNQVALTVGIIIIVYTAITGTLSTAHEGKPLGEKANAMWMPVRISMGIAMLVPKGGSGYCLAQSLVMWLTVQGIGAGDQVWNAMVDYFAAGGAIYSGQTSQNSVYMTQANIVYSLKLQGDSQASLPQGATGLAEGQMPDSSFSMLKSMLCVATYNKILKQTLSTSGESATGNNMYTAYTLPNDTTHVYFGDQTAGNASIQPGYTGPVTAGKECGAIVITAPACDESQPGSKCASPTAREQIYSLANWNMAQGLQGIAQQIVAAPSDTTSWSNYYSSIFHNSELYINYLVGYEDVLYYKPKTTPATAFTVYKQYGWILAGNYYSLLSALQESAAVYARSMWPPLTIAWEKYNGQSSMPVAAAPGDPYDLAYTAEATFWGGLESDLTEAPPSGTVKTAPYYNKYISAYGQATQGLKGNKNTIGPVDMSDLLKKIGAGYQTGNHTGNGHQRQSGSTKGQATLATLNAVKNFLTYLTGTNSDPTDLRVAQDPIMRAANYGKSLTSAAIPLMVAAGILHATVALANVCSAVQPGGAVANAAGTVAVSGLLGTAMFMYTQGAIMGVFIPLIPYVTFFVGVIGWMLQVVEAVAAAPLVAIGLIFPETQDDIWGRAKPAYMMILALFLRPPLMLVGFAAAMIVLWCLTELLNIGFLTLTAVTFRVEDMFGFVTITTAYVAIFTTVVTRSYELINVVPNKVLNWIGGPGMEVQGAEAALSAAKGGVETGAGAVGGGTKGAIETGGARFEEKTKEKRERKEATASLNKPPDGGAKT